MHAVCFFHKKVKKQQKKTLPGVNINDILILTVLIITFFFKFIFSINFIYSKKTSIGLFLNSFFQLILKIPKDKYWSFF